MLALSPVDQVCNSWTGAARQQQQHALALGWIDRGRPPEPHGDLGAVRPRVVDRHLEAGTLGVWHVATGRPFKRRRGSLTKKAAPTNGVFQTEGAESSNAMAQSLEQPEDSTSNAIGAENYYQHAEHYNRVMSSEQAE